MQKEGEDLKNMFSGVNGEEGNIEAIAGKLLEVFMNKDLLYAPLVECRGSYDDFFKKSEGKESEQDMERYKKQYHIICEIITTLDDQPDNKEKLMDLFEKMQDYGQPPAGIASVTLPSGI